jgi:CII-binding regulator of phage lambda lysogenization HflD
MAQHRKKGLPNLLHQLMVSPKRGSNSTIVKYIRIRTKMGAKAKKKTFMERKVKRRKMMTKKSLRKANQSRSHLLISLLAARNLKNRFRTI